MLPSITPTSSATGYDNGYSGGMAGDGYIRCYGIDVSEHQGTGFNFSNIKNNGYTFVILRCGVGNYGYGIRKDYRFEEYYQNAKAAGLDEWSETAVESSATRRLETKTQYSVMNAPQGEHSYERVVTKEPTCTAAGVATYTCALCGDSYTEEIPSTGHTAVPDAAVTPTCTETGLTEGSRSSVCGAKEGPAEPTLDSTLKFTATSFTMGAELKFVFIMTKATATKYPTTYVDIVVNGADGDKTVRFNLEDMVLYNNAIYRVEFTGIGAKMMGDTFTATIHAEDENGNAFIGEPKSTTIANELLTVIRKSNATSTIKTLGVDMLNYGAAAQAYFGYNAENPVNAALTEEEKAYGTQETPAVTNTMSKTSTGAITIVTPAVTLGSKVTLNMIFNTANYTGDKGKLTYKITDVTTNTVVAAGPMIQTSGNFYKCVYDDVGAKRMRSEITIGIYDENDQLVSQVQTWSVESYISDILGRSTTSDTTSALPENMIKYGDAAATYLG